MPFACTSSRRFRERYAGSALPFSLTGVHVTAAESRHRLSCLGWKTLDNGQQVANGQWCVFAQSCGHTVVALADNRHEAWSAVWSMALKATRNGWARYVYDDPRD